MSGPTSPTDGLQQERTTIAWRRTSLSLAVAALVVGRLAIEASAPVLIVAGSAAMIIALWSGLVTMRRGRWATASQSEPEFQLMLRDGRLPLAVALVAGGLCVIALALSLGLPGAF
jgi:uncharacterized membrane protein YidH (DUF202 family)